MCVCLLGWRILSSVAGEAVDYYHYICCGIRTELCELRETGDCVYFIGANKFPIHKGPCIAKYGIVFAFRSAVHQKRINTHTREDAGAVVFILHCIYSLNRRRSISDYLEIGELMTKR